MLHVCGRGWWDGRSQEVNRKFEETGFQRDASPHSPSSFHHSILRLRTNACYAMHRMQYKTQVPKWTRHFYPECYGTLIWRQHSNQYQKEVTFYVGQLITRIHLGNKSYYRFLCSHSASFSTSWKWHTCCSWGNGESPLPCNMAKG